MPKRRYVHLAALVLAGVWFPFAGAAAAADTAYVWRNVKIGGGGFVTGLLFHPARPGLLYARTDVGGAYRWEPDARTWTPLTDMLGREQSALLGVLSLAVDPHNPDLVYLACGEYTQGWERNNGAILWSADRGATWQCAALAFKLGGNEDGRSTGERLQVDPNDGGVLLLGSSRDGLWASSGRHPGQWARVAGFPAARVTFVLFDPRSGKPGAGSATVFVGTAGEKRNLYRSVDAGATWEPVPGQPADLIPHHAELDAAGALYLAYSDRLGPNGVSDGAVWSFDTGTGAWRDITPVKPSASRRDTFGYAGLTLDARHPGTIVVSTLDRWDHGDEIFRSTDGGATWTGLLKQAAWDHSGAPYTAGYKPHWIGDIKIDPFDAGHALFITGYGVWACDNLTAADSGGATRWAFRDDGLEEVVPADLISPSEGAPLLTAIYDVDGFRHDDLNASPAGGRFQPSYSSSGSIACAGGRPAIVVRTHWSRAVSGASISRDGGKTWTVFKAAPPHKEGRGVGTIAVSADGEKLVWLPQGSGPFFSTDQGRTWRPSRGGPVAPGDYRLMRPTADRVNALKFYLYDSIRGEVQVSSDGGASFALAAHVPVGGGALQAVPGQEGGLWLPTAAGLLHSTDSGATFARIPAVQRADEVGLGRAAAGRPQPAVFLAGIVDTAEGIFRSDDGGASWVRIDDRQHRFGWISGLAGDPRVPGRVYLMTSGRGIIYGEPAAANAPASVAR